MKAGSARAVILMLVLATGWLPRAGIAQGVVVGSDSVVPGDTASIRVSFVAGGGVNDFDVDVAFDDTFLTANVASCGFQIQCEIVGNEVMIRTTTVTLGVPRSSGFLALIEFSVAANAPTQVFPLTVNDENYRSCFIDSETMMLVCLDRAPSDTMDGAVTVLEPPQTVPTITSGSTLSFGPICPGGLNETFLLPFTETGGDLDGTADCALTSGADFSISPALLNVPAGGSASLLITALRPGNGMVASDTLNCTLDGATPYSVSLESTGGFFGRIVSIFDESGLEGDDGNSVITLQASVDAGNECLEGAAPSFTVPFATEPGSATSEDFTASTGTLSFSGTTGENREIAIQILGDDLVELDETLLVRLGDPSSSAVSVINATATATIVNDDAALLTLGSAARTEGDAGFTQMTFPMLLDAPVDRSFEVDFASSDGTATTADNDYVAVAGTLGFAGDAGELQFINVSVIGDQEIEPDESFDIEILQVRAGGRDVQPGNSSATGTIRDDDGGGSGGSRFVDLTPLPSAVSGDRAGTSVAVSGSTAVVGIPGAENSAGLVAIYDFSSGAPILDVVIPKPEAALPGFGREVAIDGDILVVGTDGVDGLTKGFDPDALTAVIYERVQTGFQQLAGVKASQTGGGGAVALGPGLVLVGSPDEDRVGVFEFLTETVTLVDELTVPGPKGAVTPVRFGISMAFSVDKLAVGAPGPVGGQTTGSVYLYQLIGANLSLAGVVQGISSQSGDAFGTAVAVFGTTLVVGAPQGGPERVGIVDLFDFPGPGGKGVEAATIGSVVSPAPATDSLFGNAVAVEGANVLVGAPGDLGGIGALYLFSLLEFRATPAAPAGLMEFGADVDVEDGTIMIGAPGTSSDEGLGLIAVDRVFRSSFEAAPDGR